MRSPSVSVVMPCLDEASSVGMCVREAKLAFERAGVSCEVIVADNGSTDGSAGAAEAAGAVVVGEPARGYGSAVSAGIAAASGEVILLADSDGTYPMEQGPALARAAGASEDIVLGSRFSGEIAPGAMPFLHRTVGSPATRLLLRVLCGVRCSDPHSGMRAMRRTVFEKVRPRSTGWEFTVEMLVNAERTGTDVREVPIDYRERIGTSKLRAIPEGWSFFRFLVLNSPTFLFVLPGVAMMLAGSVLLSVLLAGDRRLGRLELGVNSLVVGSLATIMGYQLVVLGVSARVHMRGTRRFPLERGILAGALVLAAGIGLVALVAARWWTIDFGPLQRSDHGIAILGLTAAVLGMQTVFSSFFLTLLSDRTTERPPGAGDQPRY